MAEPAVAQAVRAILSVPDEALDYADAKLAIDRLIEPATNVEAIAVELDRMAEAADHMAGPGADESAKLRALRQLIYESGPWNEHRPFGYDHSNFRGRNVRVKLLSHYLETRRGDCVSMPILFLILADKLGLEVTLARTSLHLYLHHHEAGGLIVNLETTSGALPAREVWMRQVRPITDRAVETGLYMRVATRRETVAMMAKELLQYLREQRRAEDMIAVARIILEHDPLDAETMVEQAIAYSALSRAVIGRYPNPYGVPEFERLRYLRYVRRNQLLYAQAEALGWKFIT